MTLRLISPVGNADTLGADGFWIAASEYTTIPAKWRSVNDYAHKYPLTTIKNPDGTFTYKDWVYHTGVDLNLTLPGNYDADKHAPVYAIYGGYVVYAQRYPSGSWGNIVVIRSVTPDGIKFWHRYAHMDSLQVVAGKEVLQGQQLGTVGNAFGRFPYHLHFDLSLSGKLDKYPGDWPGLDMARITLDYVDPLKWLRANNTETNTGGQPPVELQPYIVNSAPGLRFRQWWSASAQILKVIPDKTPIPAYDLTIVNGADTWRLVNINGQIGAMVDAYLKPAVAAPPPEPPAVNVIESIIDISHNNPVTDPVAFKAAIAAGQVTGIIHKATEGDGSDGWVDSTYFAYKAAYGPSVLWWAYHFGNNDDPLKQAQNFLNVVKPDGTFGLILDLERNETNPANSMTLSQAEIFAAYVEAQTGVKCWIYTNLSYLPDAPNSPLGQHKLWFANANVPPTRVPTMFTLDDIVLQQFRQIVVPGIIKPVGNSRFVGTSEQLRAAHKAVCGKVTEPPEPPHVMLYVDTDALRLRQDVTKAVGPFYPKGTAVQVTGDPVSSGDYLWVRVVGPDGKTGWMAREDVLTHDVYLVATPPDTVPIPHPPTSVLGVHTWGWGSVPALSIVKECADAGTPMSAVVVLRQAQSDEHTAKDFKAVSPKTLVFERCAPNAQDAARLLDNAGIKWSWAQDDLFEVGKKAIELYVNAYPIDPLCDGVIIFNEPVVVNTKGTTSMWQGIFAGAKLIREAPNSKLPNLRILALNTPNFWPALPYEFDAETGKRTDLADPTFWPAPETAELIRTIIHEGGYLAAHLYRYPDPGGAWDSPSLDRIEEGISYLPADCRNVPVVITEFLTYVGKELSSEDYIAGVRTAEANARKGKMNLKALIAWVLGSYFENGHGSDISAHAAAIVDYVKTTRF